VHQAKLFVKEKGQSESLTVRGIGVRVIGPDTVRL
jgi:hypothetical protein